MSKKNSSESVTQFLNVDLELVATTELGPLVAHLSDATFTLRDSVDAGRRTVWVELARDPQDADAAIRDFIGLIESLPRDLRQLWNDCEDRCLNVGIQSGLTPHASAFRISPTAIAALGRTSARLEVTVYGAGVEPRSVGQTEIMQIVATAWIGVATIALVWLVVTSMPIRRLARHLAADDLGVTVGPSDRLLWTQLQAVSVETTGAGPWNDDFFVVLSFSARPRPIRIPEPLVPRVLEHVQRLPGFDHEIFARAIGTTDRATFLCWKKVD